MPVFDRVAFVGSGLIGAGLAATCVAHDVRTVLYTRRDVEGVQKRMMIRLISLRKTDSWRRNNAVWRTKCTESQHL